MMKQLKQPNLRNFSHGFTIIEMLVYIAIFTVVSAASVLFVFSLNDLIKQYQVETALYRSGTNVMEQVLLAVRQSDQVDVLNTVEDSPSTGKLTVENTATTTMFTLSGGSIGLSINGKEYGDLTTDTVTVNGFTVYYYPLPDDRQFVRVRLDLTATAETLSKNLTLYGGAVVRGAM